MGVGEAMRHCRENAYKAGYSPWVKANDEIIGRPGEVWRVTQEGRNCDCFTFRCKHNKQIMGEKELVITQF